MFVTTEWLAIFGIIFLTSFVKGSLGFGTGLVAMPVLLLFLPPQTAVFIVLAISLLMDAINVYTFRNYINFKRIILLIIASLLAIPLGTYTLQHASTTTLTIGINGIILLFAVIRLLNIKFPIKNERTGQIVVGLLVGFFGASTSITGPPIALFYSNQGMSKNEFRGSLASFFIVLYSAMFVSFYGAGFITPERLQLVTMLVPAVLIGVFSGTMLSKRVSEQMFTRAMLILIVITSMTGIAGLIW